jgi:vacuolar protein sorting-associated protein 29
VVTIGQFRVGLCHGHQLVPWADAQVSGHRFEMTFWIMVCTFQVLALLARQLDVDVMVYGHTHQFEAYERDGRFFINPGSATGAFSALNWYVVDSFTPQKMYMLTQLDHTVIRTDGRASTTIGHLCVSSDR